MKLLSLLSIICLFSLNIFAQTPAKKIPAFDFLKLDNTSFKKDDLDSSKKVLFIYFDATCSHCQIVINEFNNRLEELKDIQVVLVTLDVVKAIDYFMDNFAPDLKKLKNVIILRDTDYQFIHRFQPKRYPGVFLYADNQELIIYTHDDKQIDKVFSSIKD
jgi:hypothetical protein